MTNWLHDFLERNALHTAGPDNFKYNKILQRMTNTLAIEQVKEVVICIKSNNISPVGG